MNLPKRKKLRLQGYDYSQNNAYFITICTYNRIHLFGKIVGSIHESTEMRLSRNVDIIDSAIYTLPNKYPNIEIPAYIIMPNHIHMIVYIKPTDERAIRESPLQNKRSLLSKLVGCLKMNTSKEIHLSNSNRIDVWQRGYNDHIIRNENDHQFISNYILNNPITWEKDCFYDHFTSAT